MILTVHLHTILQKETPEGLQNRVEVNMPAGSTLGDLLASLEITQHPDSLLLAVNGRVADIDQVLRPGDQVNLMPAISGG